MLFGWPAPKSVFAMVVLLLRQHRHVLDFFQEAEAHGWENQAFLESAAVLGRVAWRVVENSGGPLLQLAKVGQLELRRFSALTPENTNWWTVYVDDKDRHGEFTYHQSTVFRRLPCPFSTKNVSLSFEAPLFAPQGEGTTCNRTS